ncbi:MAG: soluble lytic murein transglycosylase-like protein [Bacteroidota bacterium]|jgi:membrane-bound lytic murein transglycosylase D|nr:soluble lytic murein transglycosylase-like protein [Bacteroidota bacterium]
MSTTTKLKHSFKKALLVSGLASGSLFAQNTLTMTDNPVAAMLDSLANQKVLEKALSKPVYPKTNKYKYAVDSVPRFEDFVYENRLAKLDANSPFDLVFNPHVKGFIELYAVRKRELVSRVMGLSQLYYPMFEEVFDKHNIPLELKHLAVIESALNPNARSRCGATGLWQFMYPTGKMYGLNVNSYIDERSDVYKATEAAAEYLKSLYGMFGDWQMVLAAYNAGPGTISKAIRRSGGKKTYWEIRPYLPLETQSYVPAFIAANYVMNYPTEHNIYAATPRKTYFEVDTAVVKESMTFNQIATALDISVEEIAYFNPQYRKSEIPAGGNFLTLPKAKIGTFLSNETEIYAAIKSQRMVASENTLVVKEVQKTHTVRNGEKLGTIARKYGVTVADLKSWNYIGKKGIRAGKKLIVYVKQDVAVPNTGQVAKSDSPKAPQTHVATKDSTSSQKLADKTSSGTSKIHKVKKGETLYGISKKYNISVDKLIEINGLKKNPQLLMGQQLKLVS